MATRDAQFLHGGQRVETGNANQQCSVYVNTLQPNDLLHNIADLPAIESVDSIAIISILRHTPGIS